MSDEPLYCPFCGAEDFACSCVLPGGPDDFEVTHGPFAYCEVDGVREPCPHCEADRRRAEARTREQGRPPF